MKAGSNSSLLKSVDPQTARKLHDGNRLVKNGKIYASEFLSVLRKRIRCREGERNTQFEIGYFETVLQLSVENKDRKIIETTDTVAISRFLNG